MSRRTEQLASTLHRAIQEVIGRGFQDPRISGLITVTSVKVTEDMRSATVMVSVLPAERQNLTMRMSMRRFTRLTNAFSKKLDNHIHAIALYFVFYNFCRIHKTLRTSPAMAAGITDRLWSLEDVIARVDADAPSPKPRGPYRKRENSN